MGLLGAIAVGSSIVSAIGGISKGRQQKRLADERAEQKRFQQMEILRRTESEIQLLKDRANDTIGFALTQYAGGNISVSSGAAVQNQMQSFENLGRSILNKRLEAKFRNTQLSAEERWARKQGEAFKNSSIIDAFGGLLQTGVGLAKANPGTVSSGNSVDILGGSSTTDAGFATSGMEGMA